jgi:hypothetical protein
MNVTLASNEHTRLLQIQNNYSFLLLLFDKQAVSLFTPDSDFAWKVREATEFPKKLTGGPEILTRADASNQTLAPRLQRPFDGIVPPLPALCTCTATSGIYFYFSRAIE